MAEKAPEDEMRKQLREDFKRLTNELAKVSCPFAHNPLELDLIQTNKKISNLKGVVQSQTRALKASKTTEPWRPANLGVEEDLSVFQPYINTNQKVEAEDGDNEEKPKSIFERENLARDPFDEKE